MQEAEVSNEGKKITVQYLRPVELVTFNEMLSLVEWLGSFFMYEIV